LSENAVEAFEKLIARVGSVKIRIVDPEVKYETSST
jgi:hypothetical protein